jgi:solute carrier family 13 (sodium-dependent dicarboxylate transporter), member 2/3/5
MYERSFPADEPVQDLTGNIRSESSRLAKKKTDRSRSFFILLGIGLFLLTWLSPSWGPAVDPEGQVFALSREGKAALGLFLLAATWWMTEVVPIGITAITIGAVQALWAIRPAREAFTDFMDPSVWFIFGSLTIGMVFTKTGFTRRLAYKMLSVVGERTSMIYLGCFTMTAALTLVIAHTAVAATVYPLFLAIYALYREDGQPTQFGKGLFIGMAFVAGAGSIITLLGAARGAVALGFFREITGRTITFLELTYYMLPVGVVMTLLLWGFVMVWYRPEQKTIPGLRERAARLYASLGPVSRDEIVAVVIVLAVIVLLSLRSFFPSLAFLDKSAIILLATVLFFLLKIVSLDDLESTSWNIVLLFGGAMSIGYCLWQTGAAQWLAVSWLGMFETASWFVFIMGIALFVLVMTNLIMNVAAIAIVLPVALKMAEYVNVAPDVVLYSSLVVAGMPFLLLVGAAPNAIAYNSNMFTTREFLTAGLPASALLMVVLGLFVWLIWPLMGMPVLTS